MLLLSCPLHRISGRLKAHVHVSPFQWPGSNLSEPADAEVFLVETRKAPSFKCSQWATDRSASCRLYCCAATATGIVLTLHAHA